MIPRHQDAIPMTMLFGLRAPWALPDEPECEDMPPPKPILPALKMTTKKRSLNDLKMPVLAFIADDPGVLAADIMVAFGLDNIQSNGVVAKLRRDGLVVSRKASDKLGEKSLAHFMTARGVEVLQANKEVK